MYHSTTLERLSMDWNKGASGWMRVDGIDILRGAAIFFVLMNHVNMRLFLAKVPYTAGLPGQLASTLVWKGNTRYRCSSLCPDS